MRKTSTASILASSGKADRESINAESGDRRLAEAEMLELKPGRSIYRATNEDVPYELGFWLRADGLGRFLKDNVSGGDLYACPLNPVPDYRTVVKS